MLTHKQLRHVVTEQIRQAILDGQIKPGEWLRQERLAQELGVSQMPIREALKELAAEGLVEHIPYRGVRVVEFTAEDVEDLYAQRCFLEARAARAAAARISEETLAQLRELVAQMRSHLADEDLPLYRELNRQFHQLIAQASGRQYLIRTLNQLWANFPNMLWANFPQTARSSNPERTPQDVLQHEAIVEALARHDEEAAERLMREHIESAGRDLASTVRGV